MYLLTDIGKSLLSDIIQILAGCAVAALVLRLAGGRPGTLCPRRPGGYLSIVASTLCGILFPMETFGLVPVAAAAYTVGVRLYMIAPAVFANALFNTLAPFTDVGFVWTTGIYRLLTAVVIGVCSGIILKQVKINDGAFIRGKSVEAVIGRPGNSPGFPKLLNNCFLTIGPYLIVGVVLHAIFMRYIFYSLMYSINIGAIATSVLGRFKGYDITTPVFMQTMVIFYSVVNFKSLLALVSLFRLKSLPAYYLYLAVWVAILAALNILFI